MAAASTPQTQGPSTSEAPTKLCQDTLCAGDRVTIADEYGVPHDYRKHVAVVKETHKGHATVAVMASNGRHAKGELWPSYKSLVGPVDPTLRLGAKVRIVGLKGAEARMNGLAGVIVLNASQREHPLWLKKPRVAAPVLAVSVLLDGQGEYIMYPRNLKALSGDEAGKPSTLATDDRLAAATTASSSGNDRSSADAPTSKAVPVGDVQRAQQPVQFELPDWVLKVGQEVEAMLEERSSNNIKVSQASGPASSPASLALSRSFMLRPSVGTWCRPLLKPASQDAGRFAESPRDAIPDRGATKDGSTLPCNGDVEMIEEAVPLDVPFHGKPSVGTWMHPRRVRHDATKDAASVAQARVEANAKLPSPPSPSTADVPQSTKAHKLPRLLSQESTSPQAKVVSQANAPLSQRLSRPPRVPRSRPPRSEGYCWSCFSFFWVGK